MLCTCFFFNDTATTEIYTLSLHDALPICEEDGEVQYVLIRCKRRKGGLFEHNDIEAKKKIILRSEEHTSELQSRQYLVCRLLLEKKKIERQECMYYNHLVVVLMIMSR